MDPEFGMTKEIKQIYDNELVGMEDNLKTAAIEWKKHFDNNWWVLVEFIGKIFIIKIDD